MTRKIAALLALLALSTVVPAAARPARPELPTPQKIERAVRAGDLDRTTADLYLAYALHAPERIPATYRSRAPWRGTEVLLHLDRTVESMPDGAARDRLIGAMGPYGPVYFGPFGTGTTVCSLSALPFPFTLETAHFVIEYPSPVLGGGLTIEDYADALEASWAGEVDAFGWAAPTFEEVLGAPERSEKYVARVDPTLPLGLYGFVAGRQNRGDNPHTSWDDVDATESCLVLNGNFDPFFYPSAPIDSLTSTAAHEFLHSIQFGLGALGGPNAPDSVFVEGAASWVEDEVFDDADDNYNFLWPDLNQSMGDYDASPYNYWAVFRGLTERFGAGTPGGGEQVFQDFFEATSKGTGNNLTALSAALSAKGIATGVAFHDAAIAMSLMRACGGGYALPHCYEEADGYVGVSGSPPSVRGSVGLAETVGSSVRDDLTFMALSLPAGGDPYDVTVANTDVGGSLRASLACDTGSGATITAFGAPLAGGGSSTVVGYANAGCERVILVVSNEAISAPNPTSSASRSFDVTVTPA